MLYLIGIPNCNKIKDTRSWLEEKDITYEFINVKKEPLSKEEISELAYKLSTDVLVNKRGTTYRKLEILKICFDPGTFWSTWAPFGPHKRSIC